MVGIYGGVSEDDLLTEMAKTTQLDSEFEREEQVDGEFQTAMRHHGSRDSGGYTVWRNGSKMGVLFGAVTNGDVLSMDESELLSSILESPEETLERIDGSFVLACADTEAEKLVLATDKIGSRPCYYSKDSARLLFGSQLKALLSHIDDPTVDYQAVNDMLLMGNLWGDETLVEEVNVLPPATALVFKDGDVIKNRYWWPSFGEKQPSQRYLHELVSKYRDAVSSMAETIDNPTGIWLSGGLDSRSMAAELVRNMEDSGHPPSLKAFTYDSNPAGAGNPELARELASTIGISIEEIKMSPDRLATIIDKMIETTDGMVAWNSLVNLSNVFHISKTPGVMLEACGQGEFLGEHLKRYHLSAPDSVAASQYQSESWNDAKIVQSLLSVDVNPMATFEEEARKTSAQSFEGRVIETHFNNHYSRFVYASNPMARHRVGTRIPFAHGEFLEHVAKLPRKYRMGTYPFSNGTIPYGASRPKLHLIRALDPELASVPYERTRLKPSRPYAANVAGFLTSTIFNEIRGATTHSGESIIAKWIRDYDMLHEFVDKLLEDAADRECFNTEFVRSIKEEHMSGEADHLSLIAPITTLERWLQQHIDESAPEGHVEATVPS